MSCSKGDYLPKKLREAKKMYQKHKEFLDEFTTELAEADPPVSTDEWQAMIAAWEADPDAPDPYSEPVLGK